MTVTVAGAAVGVVRLLLLALTVVAGAVVCIFAGWLPQKTFARVAMGWHRVVLFCLGVRARYRCHGGDLTAGALVVSNHISWSDIVVYGARWRVTFLGNSEIAKWPLLGWVIKRAGTLFIARGTGAKQATADIAGALRRGRNVMLFPEGKTTDGESVIRFQPRLTQAAIDASAPLQPAAVRYLDADGGRVTRHSFAGDATLVGSVWRTVSGPRITAEVTLFPPLTAVGTRQALSEQAEATVRAWVEGDGITG